ncbi:hypothetical protein RRG08_011098 [Elysia crispata]|uniref:TNFR-Cys domain-containing protein n=1 Tax=Elysia crispata TaxID=231223 RepID=A0AAE1APE2_9GAST|nr:hypothetical protein RRG08_011098 [Elysia crispata]
MRVLMSTFMFVSLVTSTGNKSFCQKGTYMVVQTNGQFACNPCPRGTFNDENEYDKTSCKPCLKVSNSNPHYKVKLECTPEHNADIECAQGFYRDWYFPNDPCRVCKNCSLSSKRSKMCAIYANDKLRESISVISRSHIALCHLFILKKPYCLVPYKSII